MTDLFDTIVPPAFDARCAAPGSRPGDRGARRRAAASVMVPGLRTPRERLIQTLWFEGLGLLLVAPAYAWVSGAGLGSAFGLVVALSIAVMLWAAFYNSVFDRIEHRRTGRVASDRPHGLRTAHAVGLEVSSVLVTWPMIWALTDLGWWGALAADLGLSTVYAVHGYAFFWAFDRLRPVPGARRGGEVTPP